MKKTKKQYLRIDGKFLVTAEYKGFSPAFDAVLDKCVGQSHDGSGFGLGRRDMSWSFEELPCARKAVSKLNKIDGVTAYVDEV